MKSLVFARAKLQDDYDKRAVSKLFHRVDTATKCDRKVMLIMNTEIAFCDTFKHLTTPISSLVIFDEEECSYSILKVRKSDRHELSEKVDIEKVTSDLLKLIKLTALRYCHDDMIEDDQQVVTFIKFIGADSSWWLASEIDKDNDHYKIIVEKLNEPNMCSACAYIIPEGEGFLCGGCMGEKYCDKECQREGWKDSHKAQCKRAQSKKASEDPV